jgi:RimJ/RimL family protein N-acetyltransferase
MYTINEGLKEYLIPQLIFYSNDLSDLDAQSTSDPKRFKNKESVAEWMKKGRTIYTLENNEKLLGIFWFGKSQMKQVDIGIDINQYQYTFAGRLYGDIRGKGLFKEILTSVFKIFIESLYYDGTGFWGESRNPAMLKVCEKIGFRQVGNVKIDTSVKSNSYENPQVLFVVNDNDIRNYIFKNSSSVKI